MTWLPDFLTWLQDLNVPAKISASAVILTLATLCIAVIWQPPRDATRSLALGTSDSMWPADKSLAGLKRRLERTSIKNRQLLLVVLDAAEDGIYANELAKQTSLPRDEAVYRAKELSSQELVEIVNLTDINYRIADSVHQTVGPNGARFLRALLQ